MATFKIRSEFDSAKEMLKACFGTEDNEESSKIYDEWARTYDDDMVALGFRGYEAMGKHIMELAPNRNLRILDLGCGSGRFGKELKLLGYSNIFGVEPNVNFLERSRKRGVYVSLQNSKFGSNITEPYEDGYFDVVAAVSVFGPGTIDHTAFPEINRIIAPGGFLTTFIRMSRLTMEQENFNVKKVFEEWVTSGQWERLPDVNSVFYGNSEHAGKDDLLIENSGAIVTLRKIKNET